MKYKQMSICLVLSVPSKTADYQLVLCFQYTFVHRFLYTGDVSDKWSEFTGGGESKPLNQGE